LPKTKPQTDKGQKRAGVGGMPNIAIRPGIDQPVLGSDRNIHGKVSTEVPDRVPAQSQPRQKKNEAQKIKSARIWEDCLRKKPDHLNPETKARNDNGPEQQE